MNELAEDTSIFQAIQNLLESKGPCAIDPNGNTPLVWAARNGKYNIVKYLVEKYQLPLNVQNFEGETALSVAVLTGHGEIVRFLIERGAQLNIGNCRSETSLHHAVVLGNLEVARLLVEEGSYVDAEDDCGDTPLHFAVREDKADMVEFLLHVGANAEHANQDEENPTELAEMLGSSSVKNVFLAYRKSCKDLGLPVLNASFGAKSPLLLQKSTTKKPLLPVEEYHGVSPTSSLDLSRSNNAVWQGTNSSSSYPKRLTPTSNLPGGYFTGRQLINV